MHKRLVNECRIALEVQTQGPLLIKAGLPGLEGPDMAPVLTLRQRPNSEPYIPGSSLKGVLRSHAERLARTLCNQPDEWKLGACNPFRTDARARDWAQIDGACAVKLQHRKDQKEQITPPVVYHDSCPPCKIFGNTFLIGRLSVPDAYVPANGSFRIETRDGIGIDRFTGGAAQGAKFDLAVVTNATFTTILHLSNFEIWQLGLLACVLYDLSEGLIAIGSGKSRGLGQVTGVVQWVEVRSPTRLAPVAHSAKIWGLRALEHAADRDLYGYWHGEEEGIGVEGLSAQDDPWASTRSTDSTRPQHSWNSGSGWRR